MNDNQIKQILDELDASDNLRKLNTLRCEGKFITHEGKRYLNLSSNDYLGLSDCGLQSEFFSTIDPSAHFLMSNPSSRLITGNSPEYDQLEATISALYGGRAALVAGSGYLLNSGVLPAVTTKGDLIIGDKLLHASIIDGLRLCEAEWIRYNHNDLNHLESLLKKHRANYRNVWIATESLFSMDGDHAPLKELIELKNRYDLRIYLDEAHSFGVYGDGAGYARQLGVDDQIDILIATLGKALSSSGAFAVCSANERELLVNRMRTVIFSTALPPINLLWSDFLISNFSRFADKREHLMRLSEKLGGAGHSYIIPIMAGENSRAIEMSTQMREAGFWVTPIRYPTVPQGKARVRISLSAALDTTDIDNFMKLCKQIG